MHIMKSMKKLNTSVNAGGIGGNLSGSGMLSGANGAANSANNYPDQKTFVKILHTDNKLLLLNSLSSCLHMLNYLKEQLSLNKDDAIDLIDMDGGLKEIPNLNNKDYAIQFLSPMSTYVVLKIEMDANTNEKRYTPLLVESRLTANMIKTITALNIGKNLTAKDKAKLTRETRLKQQQQLQQQLLLQQQQQQSQQPQQQAATGGDSKSTSGLSGSGQASSSQSSLSNTNASNGAGTRKVAATRKN